MKQSSIAGKHTTKVLSLMFIMGKHITMYIGVFLDHLLIEDFVSDVERLGEYFKVEGW